MGLFGPRKLCPVCGNPASRFLSTKVEDQPLCGDCSGKVAELSGDIRDAALANMTALREYFAVFDENMALRTSFQETFRHEFGIFGGCICLDVPQRLLKLSGSDNAFVFEPQNILSFRISQDAAPVFEGTKDALVCYESTVPARVRNMGPQVQQFRMEKQQYEHMEDMERMLREQAERTGTSYTHHHYSAPDIDLLNPFAKYLLHIELDHPYRKTKKDYKETGPGFSDYDPTIEGYLEAYDNQFQAMSALAENLMAVINPDAPRRQAAAQAVPGERAMPSAPAAPVDAVAEIQKYKGLLDSGTITEEEFTAKKRKLLGI